MMESKCDSFNIGPSINDHVVCQLSDSDHARHPEDLKTREGFTYIGTEVGNKKTQPGPSWRDLKDGVWIISALNPFC